MAFTYLAHGLAVASPFELPGMAPVQRSGLPQLTLLPVSAATLDSRWSGGERAPAWQGRLGDGMSITLELGQHGAALFTLGDSARFLLIAGDASLMCACDFNDARTHRALLTKILPIVGVLGGYEALHASAVVSPWGVLAFLAASGTGKTTLAIEFMRRGWPLFSDDILTLGRGPQGVLAHPGTPHMNLDEADAAAIGALATPLATIGAELWLGARHFARRPLPVRMICLLERGGSAPPGVTRESATPLLLAPYMLGVREDPQRSRDRFALYSDLARSAGTLRLAGGLARAPRALADLVEGELAAATPELLLAGVSA